MTVELYVKRGATTYTLYGDDPFGFISLTGTGMADVIRFTEQGPMQYGATDIGFTLAPRLMMLHLMIVGGSLAGADTYRDQLIEAFKPVPNVPMILRYVRDDGEIREISCHTMKGFDLANQIGPRMGYYQEVKIPLTAANPIWYDPTLKTATFNLDLEGFPVEFVVPMAGVANSAFDQTQTFNYTGNWHTYPTIIITGPAENPVITNVTTDEKLDFGTNDIAAGKTLTIDLAYGAKTLTHTDGNWIDKLSNDSDLTSWKLAADPEAAGGNNDIRVEIDNLTVATNVQFRWYNRYLSL